MIPRSPVRLRTKTTTKKVIKRGRIKRRKAVKGVWGRVRADTEFRQEMLATVPVKCVFMGCQEENPEKLTVSHYFSRGRHTTRFDKDNCDFLCRTHHYWDKQLGWEFQKQRKEKHGWDGQYTLYMKEKLGAKMFAHMLFTSELKLSLKKSIEKYQASSPH